MSLVVLAAALTGCSLISIDLTPQVRPLEEHTVEGHGKANIALVDVSGFLSDAQAAPRLQIGDTVPRVPLLVRVREELKKAAKDGDVKALVVRINSPGGTVTASDILFRELELFKG